mmetsp:Transcript_48729/g.109415  ORF Transcript_48729/g.109415 Transcript_48729/m.109415 type:complete len:297 (+) Transcript_48729:133-1023(+)
MDRGAALTGQHPRRTGLCGGSQLCAGNQSEPLSRLRGQHTASFSSAPGGQAELATFSERLNALRKTSDADRSIAGQRLSSASSNLSVPSAAVKQAAQLRFNASSQAASSRKDGLAADVRSPFGPLQPFYWVQDIESLGEFEVSGSSGEIITKMGDYEDEASSLPIAGTMRMVKGGLYCWTLQIVRQNPRRPQLQFGVQGAQHARPWRLVSSGRCSRSRDEGPWLSRPGGDLWLGEGDYIHCEADFRCLVVPLGTFSVAVNDGPYETMFEDIPLSEGPLYPVVSMGGGGSCCRLCPS